MTLWSRARSFWHNVLHRSDMERNMSDELQFHVERRAEDRMARGGLSPEEARRVARLEFGSVEKYKEEARQSLGLRMFDDEHTRSESVWLWARGVPTSFASSCAKPSSS
jgi:hypothetical protein